MATLAAASVPSKPSQRDRARIATAVRAAARIQVAISSAGFGSVTSRPSGKLRGAMSRTWLSIRVELVEGRGERLRPRPGRVFAAARSHTFAALADAIDTAFARWDRSHLTLFELAAGRCLYGPIAWDEPPDHGEPDRLVRLSRLRASEQFLYRFDMGDDWTHLCTVGEQRIDPLAELGVIPDRPLPYWGWGTIPDQYGRHSADDDGETPLALNPDASELPPLHTDRGPRV